MFLKIVKNDYTRKKAITATVFLFITMAVLLLSGATNIIANLVHSIADLQRSAVTSDYIQMHLGEFDQSEIDRFTAEHKDAIAMQETMVLLNIEGKDIYFRDNESFAGTVQDISFVVQNQKFDFILDLNNEKLNIGPSQIAVPIYYMQTYNLAIGDILTVKLNGYQKEFLISEYARDAEMNTTFAGSKRFVINQDDYDELYASQAAEVEYLIEFKLTPEADLEAFQTAYVEAKLPGNGPNLIGRMFMLMSAMSDAIIAVVMILLSMMIVIIAMLCIKLTFQASMEEDLREIGVMKAVGISKKDIRKIYLDKYCTVAIIAGVAGYILSFSIINMFNRNMKLYISSDLSGSLSYFLPIAAPILVYIMIDIYCRHMLKKMDKISAVEALCAEIEQREKNKKYRFSLSQNNLFSANIYMGLRDVWRRFKMYRFLIIIFSICTFILIFPINIYNTFNAPDTCTYLGIGKSDLRIDLRRTDNITEDFSSLQKVLEKDTDIKIYSPLITCSYQIKNQENKWDYLNIETGDFTIFPLNYLQGNAPLNNGEIALSMVAGDELNKKTGDQLEIRVNGEVQRLTVSGIYQDVSNGGKTAKAHSDFALNQDAILWYIVYADLQEGVDLQQKIDYFKSIYTDASVFSIEEFTLQSLGSMIDQIRLAVVGGFVVSISIAILITVLFLKMLLSKDMSQNAIMRSLGLTLKDIKQQYMAASLTVLFMGIVIGGLLTQFLGELLLGVAMSSMGASKISLVSILWQSWLLCPVLLFVIVGISISICCNIAAEKDLSVVLRS